MGDVNFCSSPCVTGCGNLYFRGSEGDMAKWAERCDNCDRGFCHGCAGEYTGWVIGCKEDKKFCRYCIKGPKQLFEAKDVLKYLMDTPPLTREEIMPVLDVLLDGGDADDALRFMLKKRGTTRKATEPAMRSKTEHDQFVPCNAGSDGEESGSDEEEEEKPKREHCEDEPATKRVAK